MSVALTPTGAPIRENNLDDVFRFISTNFRLEAWSLEDVAICQAENLNPLLGTRNRRGKEITFFFSFNSPYFMDV